MDGRCETCKWWEQQGAFAWGTCILTRTGDGAEVETEDGIDTRPESLAYAYDYQEYQAWLGTRSNFGCVQHEPKEGE